MPDHGPRLVSHVLHAADLRHSWSADLRRQRQALAGRRADLAADLAARTGLPRWETLATGCGPYTRLPLAPDGLARLSAEQGIYASPCGRINLTALDTAAAARLAEAVADCLNIPDSP